MRNTKKIRDNKLVLLEALIHQADFSGNDDPHFYVDEMLKKLDVCEHDFNIMLRQLGDRYCRLADSFEGRRRYAINMNGCFQLRSQLIRENEKKATKRKAVRNMLLAASVATFFVILVGCV